MPRDDEWLETLLRQWTSLTSEVRVQLQAYMHLAPADRKNRRRLEKKLKAVTERAKTGCHDRAESKTHS